MVSQPVPSTQYSTRKEGACLAALFSTSCHMISLVSTSWAYPVHRDRDPNFEGLGLWQYCTLETDSSFKCFHSKDLDLPPWFHATQAFFTMAFINMTFDLILIAAITCIKKWNHDKNILLVFVGLSSCSCVFSTIAVIIFGSLIESSDLDLPNETPDLQLQVGWSYVLACVVTAAHLICPCLGAVEYSHVARGPPLLQSPQIPMVRLPPSSQDGNACNGQVFNVQTPSMSAEGNNL